MFSADVRPWKARTRRERTLQAVISRPTETRKNNQPVPVNTQLLSLNLSGPSAMVPMDAAIEYLRQRTWRVLPPYLIGMAFYSVGILIAIDVVTSHNRPAIGDVSLLLGIATLWRWGWLGVVQRRVQADLRGDPPLPLRQRLLPLLAVRLLAHGAMVWGGLLIVPAYYGLLLSGLATPMTLEHKGNVWSQVKTVLFWVHKASGRLIKVVWTLSVIVLLVVVSAFAIQILMINVALPRLLGFDSADLALTLGSWSWFLCMCYFLFLIFDLYWHVLAVILFYALESRRLGTDLRARLRVLEDSPR